MNSQEIIDFLITAKRATYAGQGEKVESLRPSSKDYHFEQGEFAYHDTYFGSSRFIGEEVVYKNNQPIWAMNYRGQAFDKAMEGAIDVNALRPAMMKVGEGDILPVRGPKEFINGDWKYTFKVDGEMADFIGTEEISYKGELVYRLYCHGGEIE
ncbi:MAG: DUF5680 domain-containing protein [Candidatus Nanosyncoccaceae bacterium]|jgi:hypothetical protein